MWTVIKRGLRSAPSVGMGGAFYASMFVPDRKTWDENLKKMKAHGDQMFDDACPDADNGGHVNSIGMVELIRKNGYVYAYIVDNYGDLCSSCYTHETIAGELPEGPGYSVYNWSNEE